jgi:hypothetical protein
MSQDEKPSGKFPAAPPSSKSEKDSAPESVPKSSHKVIADIHSGIVMVAPVATILEDDSALPEEDGEGEEPNKRGPQN